MPVFTTDPNGKGYETRRIVNEVVLWLGFIASLATLVAFVVLINDVVSHEGVTLRDLDARIRRIETAVVPEDPSPVDSSI